MTQTKSKIDSLEEWEKQLNETNYVVTAPKEGWDNPQIVYNMDLLVSDDAKPVTVDHCIVDNVNGSELAESQVYKWSQAKSTGSHQDNEINGSFSIGIELAMEEKIKIPFIEETDFKLQINTTLDVGGNHSWGSSMSTTETIGVETTIVAGHGECIRVDSVISTCTFSVPYTLTKYTMGTDYTRNLEQYHTETIKKSHQMSYRDIERLEKIQKLGNSTEYGRPFKEFTGEKKTSYGVFYGTSGFSCSAVFTKVTPNMTGKFTRVGVGYEMVKQPN